jgi:hypothetical protein
MHHQASEEIAVALVVDQHEALSVLPKLAEVAENRHRCISL